MLCPSQEGQGSPLGRTRQVSVLPKSQGRGTGTAEAQPQQEKFHLSGRGGRHQPANWVTGEKQAQVPWDGSDTGEANEFWLLCGAFK